MASTTQPVDRWSRNWHPIRDTVGNVSVNLNGPQQVDFRWEQALDKEWGELEHRLRNGHRVQPTPGTMAMCGLRALYAGVHHLSTVLGGTLPTFQQFRDLILTPEYWYYAYRRAPEFEDFNWPDFGNGSWLTSQQLDFLALYLGKQYLNGTHLRVVWVAQINDTPEHSLNITYNLRKEDEKFVYIHWSRGNGRPDDDHFQAITPQPYPFSNDEQQLGAIPAPDDSEYGKTEPKKAETQETSTTTVESKGYTWRVLPRGPLVQFLVGALAQNPLTDADGANPYPLDYQRIAKDLRHPNMQNVRKAVSEAKKNAANPESAAHKFHAKVRPVSKSKTKNEGPNGKDRSTTLLQKLNDGVNPGTLNARKVISQRDTFDNEEDEFKKSKEGEPKRSKTAESKRPRRPSAKRPAPPPGPPTAPLPGPLIAPITQTDVTAPTNVIDPSLDDFTIPPGSTQIPQRVQQWIDSRAAECSRHAINAYHRSMYASMIAHRNSMDVALQDLANEMGLSSTSQLSAATRSQFEQELAYYCHAISHGNIVPFGFPSQLVPREPEDPNVPRRPDSQSQERENDSDQGQRQLHQYPSPERHAIRPTGPQQSISEPGSGQGSLPQDGQPSTSTRKRGRGKGPRPETPSRRSERVQKKKRGPESGSLAGGDNDEEEDEEDEEQQPRKRARRE